jgi:hypothetical protein
MATINQQPPNIDFSLQLHPTPASMHDAHPLARLRLETAWANQMTWNLAQVINYCFDTSDLQGERIHRSQRWQELWDQVQQWATERPQAFDPIWQGEAGDRGSPFPEIWFTTDWHSTYTILNLATTTMLTYLVVVSFGFYHFACIMLLTYKPGPKFAIRNPASLSDTNVSVRGTRFQYTLTNFGSKKFLIMLESYVVPASAPHRQFSSQLQSAIQSSYGVRWC